MIDLETLGTGNDACVVSIGACSFDLEKGEILNTFYMILEVQDQLDKGRVIQADTLKWWFDQSDAAKKVFNEKAKSPAMVLNTLAGWLKQVSPETKSLKVWGNGSTFDISIMEDMYKGYNIKRPWGYSGVMDLRTFRRFVANNEKIQNVGVAHNALDDAISQAKFVIEKHQELKLALSQLISASSPEQKP